MSYHPTRLHRGPGRSSNAAGVLLIGLLTTLLVRGADITPPLGIPLAGYYHERGADGLRDPLYSRALTITRQDQTMALVTLDLIGITREITDAARDAIHQTCGIPGTHVLISATHAHTGPVLVHRGRRAEALGGHHELALAYSQALPNRIAETVQQAIRRSQPARLSTAVGRCTDLAYNRRYFMRDGTVGWNPGKLNPNMVMPAGPTDPEVGVLYVDAPGSRDAASAIASYVNFAMHTDTCGGSQFSADWPGALGRLLTRYHGPQHVTLLGNGASGNVNHLDFASSWPNHGPAEQERIATILGASVLQTYKQLHTLSPGVIGSRSELVQLDLREITPEAVIEARATVESTSDDRGGNFMKLVRAYRTLDIAEREGEPFRVEVQVLALGDDLAWVSLPGEVFVELGLAIKQRSPFPVTFVVSLANENIGYIPDRRSYAEGNYEPESARCAPGSGEALVEAAVRLLTQVRGERQR
ncbi:MAG: neutral/alkaline non-lysosomal ceramidase N-terminal domain-containing protein [Verrucomicrobia bacterium]|nr:neutral/alkaline non-lysosomal ceramidase N-terminal domain-containing protein [Verrucomicrobiota bacterium]